MLHNIRQIIDDDVKWRGILRGLNETFRHRTIMGVEVEQYISEQSGIDFSRVFDQYLRTTMVPTFEYRFVGDSMYYRWTTVVDGFDMPVRATVRWPEMTWLRPTSAWQSVRVSLPREEDFWVDENFYVKTKRVDD